MPTCYVDGLYLAENQPHFSMPDAWICRIHNQVFTEEAEARKHQELIVEGRERRKLHRGGE